MSNRKLLRGKASVQRVTRLRQVSCYLPLARKVFLRVLATAAEDDMRRLAERLARVEPDQWRDAMRDAYEEALRSGCMGKPFANLVAVEFRCMRFPGEHAAEIDAEIKRWELEVEIAEMRRRKVPAPVRQAMGAVAARWGHASPEALKKALQPARLRRQKTGTKKPRKKSLT